MKQQQSECGGCGSQDQWVLHNVPHRGIYRRLCTSCVLKHHAGSFCPHCFEVYEGFSSPVNRVTCLKCDSPSHLGCVAKDFVTRYLCPSCINPRHVYFDVGSSSTKKLSKDGGGVGQGNNGRVIDMKLAKVLLAATHFASVSMNKAASVARVEADKRAKEAALTRKRAREALERVILIQKENGNKESMEIQHIPSPVAVQEPKKKPKGTSAIAAAVVAQQQLIQNQGVMALIEGKEKTGDVKVRTVGFHGPHIVQRPPTNGAHAVMGQQFQNPATVNGKERSFNLSHLKITALKLEKEKNGLLSVPQTEGKLQHPQGNHPIKEDPEKLNEFRDSHMIPQLNQGSADAFISTNNEGVLLTGSPESMN